MAQAEETGEVKEARRQIEHARIAGVERLDLSELGLAELPKSIGQLTELEFLDLSINHFHVFPEVISELAELRELNVNDNHLCSLPEAIGELTHLEELHAEFNELDELPDAIGQMSELAVLAVGANRLSVLPDAICRLTKLETLILDVNRLMELPDAIGKLSCLRSLILSENHLGSLPDAISQLKKLTCLDLSANELSLLPDWVAQLTELEELYFAGNYLPALPDAIGNLTKLAYLDVSYTDLQALPDSLRSLSELRGLYLHGNDALGLPVEVLGPTREDVAGGATPAKPADVLEYYFRMRGGKKPLNEAKLILVGFGDVGKTSLVNRLVNDTFDKDESHTPGINITKWSVQLNDHNEVGLHIWDFGGQEIMHATHQFFMTQRSLYLLVLEGRQGNEDVAAEYWLNLIKSFAENSPVIVVLNKINKHPFAVNRSGLIQKFPNVREVLETDCADKTGIDLLRKIILRETDCLPHLRDAFPAAWFNIKDRLAGMPENYLTFERFRQICAENGEAHAEAQESLAGYLHSLGIALNYRDDPRLRDTHVLNPLWVTDGIYRVLNADDLAAQKGELRLGSLPNILNPAVYPPERHGFLMELMRKFELCFRFPDEDDHYLIPDLLDKEEPAGARDFCPEECLSFEYHYPALPEGLLPRFIVRTYVLSTGQSRWRTGVILDFEGNRALVKGDTLSKRVRIAVAGPPNSRRRLLAVIHNDLEHIHRSYKFRPEEMVPVPGPFDVRVPYKKLLVLERKGIATYAEVAGDDVVDLDVKALLDGVDLEGSRRATPAREESSQAVRLFYSYSHKDEELRDELETHLKLLQRQGVLGLWHDRRITAGDEWKGQVDDSLERADVILLLVSADFIASDYCYDTEMGRALERHAQDLAKVIPIIVREVNWRSAPFAALQPLPKDGRAVRLWGADRQDRDPAWKNVADGIEDVIKELRDAKRERRG